MKQIILLVTNIVFLNFVLAQTDKYLPVTTIKETGPWVSGVEARNINLDSKILDALYTLLSNSSEIDSVIKTNHYVSYITAYKDRVYFVLSQNRLPPRVLTISRVPVENIGMIRRLDNNMLQAAKFLVHCTRNNENDIFNIFAGFKGKFYYTTRRGQYSRCYIDQCKPDVGLYQASSGYVVIPANTSSFGIRMGSYNTRRKTISISIQDQTIINNYTMVEKEGFLFSTFFTGDKHTGTYKYEIKFLWDSPNERFKVWFECYGEHVIEPITVDVNGNPQTSIQSKSITELSIPYWIINFNSINN